MLNFLNSVLLFGLLAGLIPLLIHLFNRHKVKKVYFSSLMFLKSMQKSYLRRVKIRQVLLLLIRTLIILFIVLAFARPTIKGSLGAKFGSKAKSSVVIILDDSYSMGFETKDGSFFEIGKKKASQILDLLEPGDDATLLFLSQAGENIKPTFDFHFPREQLTQAKISFLPKKLGAGLQRAFQILKVSKNLNREVYLISNFSPSGWENVKKEYLEKENKIKLFLIEVGNQEKDNFAIEEINLKDQLIELGKPFEIKAQIGNYSDNPVQNFLIGLYVDGKRVSQTDIEIEKDNKATVKFIHTAETPGQHYGYLEITDDDLLSDNRRFFSFYIPERINLLLVGEKEDNLFLQLALHPSEKLNINLQLNAITESQFARADFSFYQAIILNNVSTLSENQLSQLEKFVRLGGGLFFVLGDKIDKKFYSEKILKRFFQASAPLIENKSPSGFFTLENFDWTHPILQVYQEVEKNKIPQIRFYTIFEGKLSSKVKTLARFNNQAPALIENSLDQGKALLFFSSFTREYTDIVTHSFFVPFINRAVEYLAFDLGKLKENYLVGDLVRRELPSVYADKPITLITPDRREFDLPADFMGNQVIVKTKETSTPGIYELKSEQNIIDLFAVNLLAKDSDLKEMSEDEIKNELDGFNYKHFLSKENLAKVIVQSRYGRELWKTFAFIAFLLLIVEMVVAYHRKRESSEETLETKE
jgi:hypothetical protein